MRFLSFLNLFVFILLTRADDHNEKVSNQDSRNERQLFYSAPTIPLYTPLIYPQPWSAVNVHNPPIPSANINNCYTIKGDSGTCTSFRKCYPYFKANDVNNTDSYSLEMYDTCSYYSLQGRPMFGVCCPNKLKPTESSDGSELEVEAADVPLDPIEEQNIQNTDNNVKTPQVLYYPQISNWPPPLPTHPPDHTIPPLPTHPPYPGFPSYPSSSWPPTQKPPGKPSTQKPGTKPTPSKKPATTTRRPGDFGASCGAKNGYDDQERIVGGHNAEVNEWPWIAALFLSGRQFCGGSLIDNTHILSAAHCVAHMSSWDVARLTVRLGDHNIKINSETRHVEKRVKRVVRHRGFDSRTLYNDIAILTLDSPVEFSQNIRAVCLPGGRSDHTGKTGTVIGWGSLREGGQQPSVLQEVSIPIWKNQDCRLKYGAAAPGGIVDHMICAGQANRDSCSGDSGGPLMVRDGKWTQIGIVSWGIGCGKGEYPGVYTRVSHFLPWIYKNLK